MNGNALQAGKYVNVGNANILVEAACSANVKTEINSTRLIEAIIHFRLYYSNSIHTIWHIYILHPTFIDAKWSKTFLSELLLVLLVQSSYLSFCQISTGSQSINE